MTASSTESVERERRTNNFDAFRIAAALCVIIGHSFVLTGRDVPRDRWTDDVPPANLATTVPGIFAAGDIRAGSMKRVAAASGEGASVVPLVHAYLAPVAEDEAVAAPVS